MSTKYSRRDFLKTAALGAVGATLAACAPTAPAAEPTKPGEPAKPTTPPAKEKVKITFSMYGHPKLTEPIVDIFNKSQSEVEVVFERSEGQGYWQKLAAAVAGGTAWDCYRGDAPRALGWGPKGAVADVKPYIDADAKYPKADYLDGILDVYSTGGKTYGVPTWALTMWLYYNKKLFDAAGVAYPTPKTTWPEYVEMAKKLTIRDGEKYKQFGANGWSGWDFPVMQLVWSNGGGMYYNTDFTKSGFDDGKTAEALQNIADLATTLKVAPDPNVKQSSPVGILSDNVATEGNGDYLPADNNDVFMEKYEYLDATLCPAFNGNRSNIYWPDAFMLNAKAKNPEACYKWMSFFSRDPESTAIQCKVVFPVYKKAYEDDAISKRWLVAPRPKGMIAQAKEHAKSARLFKIDLHYPDMSTVYYGEIGKLWSGEAKAADVAKTLAQKCNDILAKAVDVQIK